MGTVMQGMADRIATDGTCPQLDLEFTGAALGVSPAFDGRTYRRALDYTRLTNNLQRVLYLLLDGRWHPLHEIRAIAPSADSRLRDLRKPKFGGFTIETKRENEIAPTGSAAVYCYRLALPDGESVRALMEGSEDAAERMAS